MDEKPAARTPMSEWVPLIVGVVFFGGGTWFWIENAVVMHQVPSFIFAFSVSFLGTAVMRQTASSQTDYLNLFVPVFALLGTLTAIYGIRMKGIREAYRMRGMPVWPLLPGGVGAAEGVPIRRGGQCATIDRCDVRRAVSSWPVLPRW